MKHNPPFRGANGISLSPGEEQILDLLAGLRIDMQTLGHALEHAHRTIDALSAKIKILEAKA